MDDGVREGSEAIDEGVVAATFCATLFDEWARLGVQHVVVSPGSRSTPLALASDRCDALETHLVLDERSAGFVAVGLAHATGMPAVLVCTSGTAAAEYHAAVVEAHQSALPLVVATADRPPELQGVGAPQTIDQRELFGSAVRWYCEPGPPEPQFGLGWRQLARDVFLRSTNEVPGPVHLNLAFREPLVGDAAPLPPPLDPPLERVALADAPIEHRGITEEHLASLRTFVAGRRGLVVAGVRAAANAVERTAIAQAASALGWPLLADHLSGCRSPGNGVVWHFDALLRQPDALPPGIEPPEVVVHLGGLISSKVTNRWLAESGAQHIGVDRFGLNPDPDQILGLKVTGTPRVFLEALAAGTAAAPAPWTAAWAQAESVARAVLATPFEEGDSLTEPSTAAMVLREAPTDGAVVLSSSMPVRDVEWFAPGRADLRVFSNRGANGIDGVISTAIGVALSGMPTTLLIGDLAFLHDISACTWLRDRPVDLRVVVVDNDGGGIFSFLPPATELATDRFERLYGTPHGLDLVALAAAFGLRAERVRTPSELEAALRSPRQGSPTVVVVNSDRAANTEVHAELNSQVAAALAAVGHGQSGAKAGAMGA